MTIPRKVNSYAPIGAGAGNPAALSPLPDPHGSDPHQP